MFILDEQQKMDIIIETCKKIDYIYFKFYAINSNFKNLKNKLSDYDHIKNLKNIEYWSAIDVFNLEKSYKTIKKDILHHINTNLDLFEDQDITFFIKYYDVTFEEDNKKFCIEI
jgi:hypothetical protein